MKKNKEYRDNGKQENHGLTNTRVYRIWSAMWTRCTNPNSHRFDRYGGRGISVCDEWRSSWEFIKWAIDNGYKENLSIDRIDNDGNYCPQNCRWATAEEQTNNAQSNVLVTAFGETKTVGQWLKDHRCKVKRLTLYHRIKRGIDGERAMTSVQGVHHGPIEIFGESKTLTDWSKDERCVVTRGCLYKRIKKYGWSPELALTAPLQEKYSRGKNRTS